MVYGQPLREALNRLNTEGFLRLVRDIGFDRAICESHLGRDQVHENIVKARIASATVRATTLTIG